MRFDYSEIERLAEELKEIRGKAKTQGKGFSQDRYSNAYNARNGRRMKSSLRPKFNYYD